MALVSELELPAFDFMDASLRGDRFHETMASLRGQGWLAAGDLGFFVLDREASEFILRSKKVKFPGLQVATRPCQSSPEPSTAVRLASPR